MEAAHEGHQEHRTEYASIEDQRHPLRRMLEALPAAIFVSDKHGNPQYANKEARRILGKGVLPGIDGSNLAELYHAFVSGTDELYPEERMPLVRALSGESCWVDDMEIRHPDGTRVLHVSANPIYGESGELEMAIAAFVDITVQKEAEDLRESLLSALPIAVRVYDKEGTCILQNQLATSLFGGDSLETHHNYHQLESWNAHGLLEGALHTLQTGEMTQGEVRLVNPKHDLQIIEYQFRRFIMHGQPHLLMRFGDVTQRNALAERSRHQTRLLHSMIESLSAASALRDPYTAGHQVRVAALSVAIADEVGMDRDRKEGIRVAGLLHDIGKLAIPAEMLAKPTKLTPLEMRIIQSHVVAASDILQNVDFPWPILDIILEHHERLDGSGYPNKRRGEQILPESRILAVADVVEAMSSHRPYRPALGIEAALDEIERGSGATFDSEIVAACATLFREGRFTFPES